MSEKQEHPSIKKFRERPPAVNHSPVTLDAKELREIVLNAGADDVGFVEINRSDLGPERDDILRFFPQTKSLISFVLRMNREPILNPARSVANVEFHQSGEHVVLHNRRLPEDDPNAQMSTVDYLPSAAHSQRNFSPGTSAPPVRAVRTMSGQGSPVSCQPRKYHSRRGYVALAHGTKTLPARLFVSGLNARHIPVWQTE